MLLRFKILANVYIYGRSSKSCDISANFHYKGFPVIVSMPGREVYELKDGEESFRFGRDATEIRFTILDKELPGEELRELCQQSKYGDLLELIRGVASRASRVIRNFATLSELPEILPKRLLENEDVEIKLRKWFAETSIDGESWTELLPPAKTAIPTDLAKFFLTSPDIELSKTIYLDSAVWPNVTEAFEDNKEPPPELEFFTNAVGHLRENNFRLAVLESIICLEIVLTQFLSNYLAISAGVPNKRAKKFLSPEIGLTARLSALLNLTLHQSYLKDVDLDKVIKVVEWRNEVMHRRGRLPNNLNENSIREGIAAVLSLSHLLAERRDNVVASPQLTKIVEDLYQKGKGEMLWPKIWLKPNHRVRIDIELFSKEDDPEYNNKLDTIVKEASEMLKTHDSRFDPIKHLMICFKNIPQGSKVWFIGGKLTL